MPEGDTIFRAAEMVHRWLAGRVLTGATITAPGVDAGRLVGATVERVESRGKHLVVHLRTPAGAELLAHTHLGMHGSWHVYPVGARWRRSPRRARLVLEAGDRVAVCFDAPVVEVTAGRAVPRPDGGGRERVPAAVTRLGPDVLAEPLDVDEVRRRAARLPPGRAVGEVLLDQRVVAGIGNIWRCEALFAERVDPWTPLHAMGTDGLARLVTTAAALMQASLRAGGSARPKPQVYRRAGRPCPRCATAVRSAAQGPGARTAYWCPTCQPAPPPP